MKSSLFGVAYLLRKTGMPLAEIKGLDLQQFQQLLEEVIYQEEVAEYEVIHYLAQILAAIANTVPRRGGRTFTASDLINVKRPTRPGSEEVKVDTREGLEIMAKRFGIKLPSKETIDL